MAKSTAFNRRAGIPRMDARDFPASPNAMGILRKKKQRKGTVPPRTMPGTTPFKKGDINT